MAGTKTMIDNSQNCVSDFCLFGCEDLDNFCGVSTLVGLGILVKSALYRPRWRPEGEVVVVSRHLRIRLLKSSSVISAGIASRVETALQV